MGGLHGGGERLPIGNARHGEFVVPDNSTTAGATTMVERMQTGSVTAVSATSITVKSTDNFPATDVVPAGFAVTAFPVGTTVRVIAKVSGSTVTLVTLHAARTPGTATI